MTLSKCPSCHRYVRNYPEHLIQRHHSQGLQQYMKSFETRQVRRATPILPHQTRIMLQVILPIRPESYANLDARARSKWHRKAVILKTFVVDKEDFNTNQKAAEFVYSRYGTGIYNILMLKMIHNKKYSRTFTCIRPDCFFYQKKLCHTYSTHYKGRACKMNKRFIVRYVKYAQVIITESPEGGYTYKFMRKDYKLNRLPWWRESFVPLADDYRSELY